MSDFPESPIANLFEPYLRVSNKAPLVADIIIEAIQILPESSLSATFKNLYLRFLILDVNIPCALTSEY